MCQNYEEIQHPAVRETLRFLDFDRGLEIHHDGDLPARSGMGSSSSFTVGFLHALYALKGLMVSKKRLAEEMEQRRTEYEATGKAILAQMKNKSNKDIRAKMVEAEIPELIINELAPVEKKEAAPAK